MLIHHIHWSFGRIWFGWPGRRLVYFRRYGWKLIESRHYHNCWLHGG